MLLNTLYELLLVCTALHSCVMQHDNLSAKTTMRWLRWKTQMRQWSCQARSHFELGIPKAAAWSIVFAAQFRSESANGKAIALDTAVHTGQDRSMHLPLNLVSFYQELRRLALGQYQI